MMFPFEETEEETQEENLYIPREYGIDFETGQLSGKMVEGYDALLVWAWLALRTPRYIVRILQIEAAIVKIKGIIDVTGTLINGTDDNLQITDKSVPVKGEITCT